MITSYYMILIVHFDSYFVYLVLIYSIYKFENKISCLYSFEEYLNW